MSKKSDKELEVEYREPFQTCESIYNCRGNLL